MRPSPMFMFDMDEHPSNMMMDVDDNDTLEMLAEGGYHVETKLTDSDFFNSFEDDFDDADIN
ncbi:hypothetical protein AQUCO_02500077v1 [Aquilegia coerulea]|uniref:Small acidic protein 1 n=1 Tax=Aquilegia coerulea TaxID=218851 RepID=A0A2G5D9D7_AQUCA|nr:hypothetical protein AQUCO_02500077v1 [Aquilegia coerulea]